MMAINWAELGDQELIEMFEAAETVLEVTRVIQKSGSNVAEEMLKHTEEFMEWKHVPPGDVYDKSSHSQYYYHAHPKSAPDSDTCDIHDDEHGHFHTFMRGPGIPANVRPKDLPDLNKDLEPGSRDILTHIIGIGMDRQSMPNRLFTVNRWVTGETWFDAPDIIEMMQGFEIDQINPSWPVNLWLSNMMVLLRPMIRNLVTERDICITQWQADHPEVDNVYEDRNLEVTSACDLDIMAYVTALEEEIERREQGQEAA